MSRQVLVLLAAVAVLGQAGCQTRMYDGKYSMTSDQVVWDFQGKNDLYSTALLDGSGGGYMVLWTDRDGLWSLSLDRDLHARGDPVRLSDMFAGRMTAADLGGVCQPAGARYAVALAPRVAVTEGSGDLTILLMDEWGKLVSHLTLESEIGPYSNGTNLAGSCDGLMVAWHRGAIGRFDSRLAGVDVRGVKVRWDRTLSTEGRNGFCPALLETRQGTHTVWGEVEVRMRRPGDEDEPGQLMHATVDGAGKLVRKPHPVVTTLRAHVPASLARHGDRIGILYKDHPEEEYRAGIYLAYLDLEGSVLGEPRRIARGDGPDPGLLLPMQPEHLATAAVRSLSSELLIGLNFLDERGTKRSGELQIYAHQVRFRRLSAVPRNDRLVLLFVEQGVTATRLLMTTVTRVS